MAEIYGFKQLTATRVRKVAATEATLNLTGPDKALITRQLAHTQATEQQYYEALTGTQHAATAVAAMAKSRKERGSLAGPSPSAAPSLPGPSGLQSDKPEESLPGPSGVEDSPKKRKKLMWAANDTEIVELYFESYIQSRDTPSLGACRQFLVDHPLKDRKAKQVQDKVKTCIKEALASN